MSHATIDPTYAAAHYGVHREANKERMGTFTHYSHMGSYETQCWVIHENHQDEYYIRYFDIVTQTFEYVFINKARVRFDVETDEKVFYVIKNKETGKYHKANSSSSSCPAIYSSKGKAQARLKQEYKSDKWVVMKWDITESDA